MGATQLKFGHPCAATVKNPCPFIIFKKNTLDYSGPLKKTPLVILDTKKIPLIIPGLEKDTLDYSVTIKKIPLGAAPRRIPVIHK